MSAVRSSLENLHNAIVKLESAVGIMEESRMGEQRDMFSIAPSNENGTQKILDGGVIASRLDNAIEKVEKLLKDGSNG
ncbi:MAG: hypothetical protein ACLFR0_08395 [Alphaproteobacteria bacterium]